MVDCSFVRVSEIKTVQVHEDNEGAFLWIGEVKTKRMGAKEAIRLAETVRSVIDECHRGDRKDITVSLKEFYSRAKI